MADVRVELSMPYAARRVEEIALFLNVFRPSDRAKLKETMQTDEGRALVFDAIVSYVERWDQASWIEEYSLVRIGKWLRKDAPHSLCAELELWARSKPEIGQRKARDAFINGLIGEPALH